MNKAVLTLRSDFPSNLRGHLPGKQGKHFNYLTQQYALNFIWMSNDTVELYGTSPKALEAAALLIHTQSEQLMKNYGWWVTSYAMQFEIVEKSSTLPAITGGSIRTVNLVQAC